MNKHTMQEIVDFFGKPCAKVTKKVNVVEVFVDGTPVFDDEFEECERWNSRGRTIPIPVSLVSDADTHDWRVVVRPHEKKELLCPSCGGSLAITLLKNDKVYCRVCKKEIPQSLMNEMLEQAR